MYLISQLWWYLTLAFLLGALIGYVLWRVCNRPQIESRYERSRSDLLKRIALLEGAAAPGGQEQPSDITRERDTAIAELKARHADELKRMREEVASALSAAQQAKQLVAANRSHDSQMLAMADDAAALRRELEETKKQHAAEIEALGRNAPSPVTDAGVAASDGKVAKLLGGPRGGKADDLKLIWGVGPKLEKVLNGIGVFHFDQIAAWSDRDLEWVDSQLGDLSGNPRREKWVDQCRKLAAGWRPQSDAGDKPDGV